MRSVNSSSQSPARNCLAADRKQDNYPLCSPAFPRDAALSLMGAGRGGVGLGCMTVLQEGGPSSTGSRWATQPKP